MLTLGDMLTELQENATKRRLSTSDYFVVTSTMKWALDNFMPRKPDKPLAPRLVVSERSLDESKAILEKYQKELDEYPEKVANYEKKLSQYETDTEDFYGVMDEFIRTVTDFNQHVPKDIQEKMYSKLTEYNNNDLSHEYDEDRFNSLYNIVNTITEAYVVD